MKKWNNPKLIVLGVENTKDDECTCDATFFSTEKNQHFCHSDNKWHGNGCKKTEGHFMNNQCKDNIWEGVSHDSKCCCTPKVS